MRNLLISLAIVGLILGSGYVVYRHGYKHGFQQVSLKWEQDKAASRAAHDALVQELAKQERAHQLVQEKLAHDADQVREAHEAALAGQRTVYEQRLLQSARRAEVYRHQAESGADAQLALAAHAARLDRALEEGLGLVRELSATLGLRDDQLRLVGQQIQNDRLLGP